MRCCKCCKGWSKQTKVWNVCWRKLTECVFYISEVVSTQSSFSLSPVFSCPFFSCFYLHPLYRKSGFLIYSFIQLKERRTPAVSIWPQKASSSDTDIMSTLFANNHAFECFGLFFFFPTEIAFTKSCTYITYPAETHRTKCHTECK